jgi:hypothetical protein
MRGKEQDREDIILRLPEIRRILRPRRADGIRRHNGMEAYLYPSRYYDGAERLHAPDTPTDAAHSPPGRQRSMAWLHANAFDRLQLLVKASSADIMAAHHVFSAVNNSKYDATECSAPLEGRRHDGELFRR